MKKYTSIIIGTLLCVSTSYYFISFNQKEESNYPPHKINSLPQELKKNENKQHITHEEIKTVTQETALMSDEEFLEYGLKIEDYTPQELIAIKKQLQKIPLTDEDILHLFSSYIKNAHSEKITHMDNRVEEGWVEDNKYIVTIEHWEDLATSGDPYAIETLAGFYDSFGQNEKTIGYLKKLYGKVEYKPAILSAIGESYLSIDEKKSAASVYVLEERFKNHGLNNPYHNRIKEAYSKEDVEEEILILITELNDLDIMEGKFN